MSKLSLDALKMRAEAVASEDLLMAISGGTENSCHDSTPDTPQHPNPVANDNLDYPADFKKRRIELDLPN